MRTGRKLKSINRNIRRYRIVKPVINCGAELPLPFHIFMSLKFCCFTSKNNLTFLRSMFGSTYLSEQLISLMQRDTRYEISQNEITSIIK
jgi:hypothetical protein